MHVTSISDLNIESPKSTELLIRLRIQLSEEDTASHQVTISSQFFLELKSPSKCQIPKNVQEMRMDVSVL